MHITTSPPRPSSLWPQIPPALDRLLLQMLHKEPARRPSVAEVEATLSAVRVALSAAIVNLIALDGESNWMEGVLLLAVYGILGMAFYALPG